MLAKYILANNVVKCNKNRCENESVQLHILHANEIADRIMRSRESSKRSLSRQTNTN